MIVKAGFEVTRWESSEPFDAPDSGPALTRVEVDKAFTGEITGTSTAHLMTCQPSESEAGYVATERLSVTVAGRQGTFVIQHGGVVDGEAIVNFGHIVPGSGTGELAGIRGTARYEHDEAGARVTLDCEL